MLGNDMVDLEQAFRESDWRRKGYLDKICTEAEQQLILTATDSSAMLWLLWSMKESAYKAENRLTQERSYAPKSFSCSGLCVVDNLKDCLIQHGITQAADFPAGTKPDCLRASVTYKNRVFDIRSVITSQYIHSIALLYPSDWPDIHLHYQQNQVHYVQNFELQHPGYSLIKDKAGLPAIFNHQTGLKHAASISHHGAYLAIVYLGSHLLKD